MDYVALAISRWGLDLGEPNDEGWANGVCPFHNDTRPSFGMNADNGAWNCLSLCGHGNFASFCERMNDTISNVLSDQDTQEFLEERKTQLDIRKQKANLIASGHTISRWAYINRPVLGEKEVETVLQKYDYLTQNTPKEALNYVAEITGLTLPAI